MSDCPTISGPSAATNLVQAMVGDLNGWIGDSQASYDDSVVALVKAVEDYFANGGNQGLFNGLKQALDNINQALTPMTKITAPEFTEPVALDVGVNLSSDPTAKTRAVAPFSTSAVVPTAPPQQPTVDTTGIPDAHQAVTPLPATPNNDPAAPDVGQTPVPTPYADDAQYADAPGPAPTAPQIQIGGLPQNIPPGELAVGDPILETPPVPDEPTEEIPDQVELNNYLDEIPTAPTFAPLTLAPWVPPVRPELPAYLFEWTPTYATAFLGQATEIGPTGILNMGVAAEQMDLVRAYLSAIRNGDPFTLYTLPPSIIDQAYYQARDQSMELIRGEVLQAEEEASSRGMRGLPRVTTFETRRIRERGTDKIAAVQRELSIEQARNGLKEFELIWGQAMAAEQVFISEYARTNGLTFESSKVALEFSIKVFDLAVELLKFDYDDQRFELERTNILLKQQELYLRTYEAELRGLAEKGRLNQQMLDSYRTAVEGVRAVYALYKDKFTEGEFRLKQNDQSLRTQAQDIDAQKLKLEAKRLEFTGYDSGIKGQDLYLREYGTAQSGFDTETRAWATASDQTNKDRDIGIRAKGLEFDSAKLLQENDRLRLALFGESRQLSSLELQRFGVDSDNVFKTDTAKREAKAQEYQGYSSKMDGERTKSATFQAASTAFRALVDSYRAQVDTDIAAHNQQIKTEIEMPLAEYQQDREWASDKLSALVSEMEQKVRARESDVRRFDAEVGQSKALSEDNTNKYNAAQATSDREIQRRLQELQINITDTNAKMQISINAFQTIMQAEATLLAGYSSAYNAGATLTTGTSEANNVSCSVDHNYTHGGA